MEYITLKDVKGNLFTVKAIDLIHTLKDSSYHIFGMDFESIMFMRKMYLTLGGSLDITTDKIDALISEVCCKLKG